MKIELQFDNYEEAAPAIHGPALLSAIIDTLDKIRTKLKYDTVLPEGDARGLEMAREFLLDALREGDVEDLIC